MIPQHLRRAAPIAACLLMAAPVAHAQTPQLRLQADWVGEACVLPATFRVTLTNTGDTGFAVPAQRGLGYGRAVNFQAALAEGRFDWNGEVAFSSEVFRTPPPAPDQPLVRLAPGQSHVYELPFDGIFEAHGGPVRETTPWRGRFVFYYSLPEWTAALLRQDGVVVPVMDEASPVMSNPLDCG